MKNEKQTLYAVAYHIVHGKDVSLEIDYMHAESPGHARNQFCYQYPNRRKYLVIDVAPVVGYFIEDGEQGKILSVS